MLHLKSLGPPESSPAPETLADVPPQDSMSSISQPQVTSSTDQTPVPKDTECPPAPIEVQERYVWPEDHIAALEKFLSPPVITKLKQLYEEGPEPPFVSDSGWRGRQAKQGESSVTEETPIEEMTPKRGRGRDRGGRGRDGSARGSRKREDDRRVVTDVRTFSLGVHVTKRGT